MRVNFSELTERELLICLLVADDKDNADIAQALGISRLKLRQDLCNIYEKLHVKKKLGLVELLRLDLRRPFLDPPKKAR
jgi:DNA-binding CsgD family transcriptional regulator